jgi:hypothetical protein
MHYYPSELAAALQQRWPVGDASTSSLLPSIEVLTQLISTAYQAPNAQLLALNVEQRT